MYLVKHNYDVVDDKTDSWIDSKKEYARREEGHTKQEMNFV